MSAQRLWNRRINKKAVGETAEAGDPPGWRDRPKGSCSVRLSDEAASAPSRRSWLGTRSKHQWLACQQEVPATMGNISVRGWSDQQLGALKEEASRQGISMNRLVLQRLTMGNEAEGPNPANWMRWPAPGVSRRRTPSWRPSPRWGRSILSSGPEPCDPSPSVPRPMSGSNGGTRAVGR